MTTMGWWWWLLNSIGCWTYSIQRKRARDRMNPMNRKSQTNNTQSRQWHGRKILPKKVFVRFWKHSQSIDQHTTQCFMVAVLHHQKRYAAIARAFKKDQEMKRKKKTDETENDPKRDKAKSERNRNERKKKWIILEANCMTIRNELCWLIFLFLSFFVATATAFAGVWLVCLWWIND